MSLVRRTLASLAILVALALVPAGAGAQVQVGQTETDVLALTEPCEYEGNWDEFQISVSSGTSYAAPTGGAITTWSHRAGPGLGQRLIFKVFRLSAGTYTVVGHDERNLTPEVLNTFPVDIPVQAGDVIGLHLFDKSLTSPTFCDFFTGNGGDVIGYREANAGDGVPTAIDGEYGEFRFNVSATLLLPPTLIALSPPAGSITGGTKVTVLGTNLASIRAVSFGSVPATDYTVVSEGQITATAPSSETLSKVPVTVTTAAGSATTTQTFAYEGCKVPGLAGKKLKAAKKKLKKAGCKAGKVTKKDGATGKTGKVSKQSPKAGKLLAPGAKVKLTLKPL